MIPDELKKLKQWAVSAPGEKAPRNPHTGQLASVTDPSTWCTYEDAVSSGYPAFGFMLSEEDPYAVIDLDATDDPEIRCRQLQVFQYLDTYTERSQSGKGAHMLLRGKLPHGVRRDKIEVYTQARYILMTGDVVRASPIADGQELLDILYREMNRNAAEVALEEYDETVADAELFEIASRASNGEKFDRLCRGDWEGLGYPSQSEADYALMNILAFYTRSNEQAMRLFRYSALGKRDKAQRDKYLERMLRKIRASEPERIDFSSLLASNGNGSHAEHVHESAVGGNGKAAHGAVLATPIRSDRPATAFPPGFIGEVAKYIYESSSRPVKEIATAAALSFCAGVVGRQFNTHTDAGLNLYLIILARTGTGKEEATKGIDRIVAAIRPNIPVVDQFIGPGTFASGPALIRTLDERPCFVSVLGEFGLTLQALSAPNAAPHQVILKRVYLDVYSKSGRTGVLRSSAYADKEKNTKVVFSPAVTLFGESTPETFYDGLSEQLISEGLLPRFSIMEYTGGRPPRNREAYAPPPEPLVTRFADLVTTVLQMQGNNTWVNVQPSPEALAVLDRFDAECDKHINEDRQAIAELWNRAHLKALKLAALLAAVENPHQPTVTKEMAEWAVEFCVRDANAITSKFEEGVVGDGEQAQVSKVRALLEEYVTQPYKGTAFENNKDVREEWHAQRVISWAYLLSRCYQFGVYKSDRRPIAQALRDVVKFLVESGDLLEIPKEQVQERFNCRREMFAIPQK